ncbi:MAG: carboxypeptidase regulatory-like domain-containing protein [Planctomycetes bacterium]|nr:carboxypeptidase regulatory-like domain-containing protein [Planctomycetota bacterium]
MLARPTHGIGALATVEPDDAMPIDRRSVGSDGVVIGRVAVRRPDGVLEGVAAQLALLVNDGVMPTAEDVAAVRRVPSAADGSFVVETESGRVTHCVAEHIDGVVAYTRLNPSLGFHSLVLDPAGRIRLLLPGNAEAFTLLMTPSNGASVSREPERKGRLQVAGVGERLEVSGVPMSWGAAQLSVQFHGGTRVDVRDSVPLVFRQWSEVVLDRAAAVCSISGTVENLQGEPIARAHAHVYALNPLGAAEYQDVDTDRSGRFRIDNLRAGRHRLIVSADGYVPLSEEVTLADAESRDLGTRVLTVGATLRGRVVGVDVAAHSVSLAPWGLVSDHTIYSAPKRSALDQDGAFSFQNVAAGSWRIAVHLKKPEMWQTPWIGCRATVRDGDAEVDMGVLRLPGWSRRSIILDAPEVTTMAEWRVVAIGMETPWCSYGVVDSERVADLEVGPGDFLFGLSIPSSDSLGLIWCGVFDSSVRVCRVPAARAILDCSLADVKRGYTLSVAYVGGPAWPPTCLPLESETKRVDLAANQFVIPHLPVGAFEIRVSLAGETRTVPVVVATEHSVVACVWPF